MSLRPINSKDVIKFNLRDKLYYHELVGDDIINAFDRNLMDICLEQYHDILKCKIKYDDICFISVSENRNNIIYDLPINLSELYITRSYCTSFSIPKNTAENLKIIRLDYTNLTTVPNISHCIQLQSCMVSHSNIKSFHGPIPENLIELNLRYNMIDSFDFTLALQLQNLDLNNNQFTDYNVIKGKGKTFSYLQQNTYVHNIMNNKNAPIHIIKMKKMRGQTTELIGIEATLFSEQSVHLSSINLSVHKSILAICDWIKTNDFIVKDVTMCEIQSYINDPIIIKFLISALESEHVHSLTNYTYNDLFKLVWCVAMNHKDKLDIIERISIEIIDSIEMCFTGKINRIVNSLTGLLECVSIGISTKEQIQLNIQRIVKRVTDKRLNYIDGICEIKELFINDTDNQVQSWLEAFSDYEPDPVTIMCNRNINGIPQRFAHKLTYDNMIIDRGIIVGEFDENTGDHVFFYDV